MRYLMMLAALGLGAPAVAKDEPAAPAAATAKPAKPKKVCRQPEVDTTSRIGPGKVCRTEDEWAEIDAKGKSSAGRMVRSVKVD